MGANRLITKSSSGDEGAFAEYELRISQRARRVQIRVSPLGRIEVVIPKGFDPAVVPAVLQSRRAWLERAFTHLAAVREAAPAEQSLRPDRIHLRAVDEIWHVEYRRGAEQRYRLAAKNGILQLTCPQHSESVIGPRLQRWLSQRAKQELSPWLFELSEELAMPISRVRVAAQKTRWGSCSAKGTISLNRNLMFLPPALVRYLFIHELCHTQHMNHSPHFWKLVAHYEPDYRHLDRQLRNANQYLPMWIYI